MKRRSRKGSARPDEGSPEHVGPAPVAPPWLRGPGGGASVRLALLVIGLGGAVGGAYISGFTSLFSQRTLVLVGLATLPIAVAWGLWIERACRKGEEALSEWAADRLLVEGGTLSGDALGNYELTTSRGGAEITVENRVARGAPWVVSRGFEPLSCVVKLPVRAPDLVVCRRYDHAAVAAWSHGSLSDASVATGDEEFDAMFELYPESAEVEAGGDYRDAPAVRAIVWARQPILDRLRDLGLRWAAIEDGTLTMAFDPLEIEDIERALRVAASIHRALTGVAGTPPELLPRAARRPPREPLAPLQLLFKGAAGAAILGGVGIAPIARQHLSQGAAAFFAWVGVSSLLVCAIASRGLGEATETAPRKAR